ncbi:NIPSNAP family protein [Candidatus Bathyarchaeota archaeon]|nr:NIPSNAP family protein [Candidatus Bathyarchaeota archaeon]
MIYEWRVYDIPPGKMVNINSRFANITLKLFQRHGIKVIGFWEAVVGTSNTLYYMIAFNDLGHREKSMNAFMADPDWIKARAETEKDGPIVTRIQNMLLRPTSYSPLQ